MATAIDERIVAAKFDASDFEKGVDKTVKKLDELKKSLNFKDATKGVKELAEKTEASTDSMNKSLEKLTDRFTNFAGMIKQKILSGLADEVAGVFLRMEQSVKSFIKSISTDQIGAGMSKYEQILTSVRMMISAGESQDAAYEQIEKLGEYSDQTSYSLSQMTDALSKMRAAGVDLKTATKSVEGIANACANAGVNAMDAQRAFYNLSQAYSSGGLKYTDYRSLELLNMTTETFRKNLLEAAVEAGTLKKVSDGVYQTIKKNDKKVTAGKKVTMQNITDALKYNFMNNNAMNILFGKKFYFDEQEFKKYKKKYTDQYGNLSDEGREKAIADAKKDFGELAVSAYLAAREARSFVDVLNTIKDAVSTGWSTTFEHLFGKLDEATSFFTKLTEGPLAEVIYSIGEYRNAVLGFWNEEDAAGRGTGGELFRKTILNIADSLGILLNTFLQVLPGFNELDEEEEKNQPTLKNLGERFKLLSISIAEFSLKVKNAAIRFREFMNSSISKDGKGPTRIELIREIFSNLASVLGIVGRAIGIVVLGFDKLFYAISPITDGLLQIFASITQPIEDLKNNDKPFQDIEDTIANIAEILGRITEPLRTVMGFLGKIGQFIASMALDTFTSNLEFAADVFALFVELITGTSAQEQRPDRLGVIEGIAKAVEDVKNACSAGAKAAKEFFDALFGDIRTLLGLNKEVEGENKDGGAFSGIIKFFKENEFVKSAKAWINKAFIDIGDFIKNIPNRLKEFSTNIFDTVYGLFFRKEAYNNSTTGRLEEREVLTPLGEWADGVINSIKNFIAELPSKIIAGVGKIGDWINDVFNHIFGTETLKFNQPANNIKGNKNGKVAAVTKSRFDLFIENTVNEIKAWYDELPKKIEEGMKSIGSFFTKLWGTIDEFLFGKKYIAAEKVETKDKNGNVTRTWKYVTKRYKAGFSKMLDNIIVEFKKFILNIPTYIKSAIKGTGDFIASIVGALFGKKNGEEATKDDVQKKIEEPFRDISLTWIIDSLKDIGQTILNQLARIFTGTDDVEANEKWFSETIANGIKWIREKADAALKWVLEFFPTIPEKISNFFTGEKKGAGQETGPIGKAISDFGDAIGSFIAGIPGAIAGFFKNAIEEIGEWWNKLYKSLIGEESNKEELKKKDPINVNPFIKPLGRDIEKNLVEEDKKAGSAVKKPGFWSFIANIGESIKVAFTTVFENLPVWIGQGLHAAIVKINEGFQNLTGWLHSENAAKEMQEEAKKAIDAANKSTEEISKETTKAATEGVKEGSDEEESPLLEVVKSIGQSLYNFFIVTIPGFLSEAWEYIKNSDVLTGIKSIFDEDVTPETDIGKAIQSFGLRIKNFIINDIPKAITDAFDFVKKFLSGELTSTETIKAEIQVAKDLRKKPPIDVNTNTAPTGPIARDIEKKLSEENKKAGDAIKKPGFWSFASEIGESIKNAFSNAGPTILNALSTAFDFLGEVATFVTDALTGKKSVADQIDDAYKGQKPELVASLKRIGESIKNFLLDTIPKLIGGALGTLIANVPKWFSTFFTAVNEAKDKEAKKAGVDDGGAVLVSEHDFGTPKGAMGLVRQLIDTLKSLIGEDGDFILIIATIITLTKLFGKLSELFNNAGIIDSTANLVKWMGITIAISAIAGILSYITQIVDSGDPDRIQNFEDILDKIASLMEKLAWVFGLVAVGKIADAIGTERATGKVSLGEKLIGGLGDAVTNFFGTLAAAGGAYVGSGLISASMDTIVTGLTDALTTLSAGVDQTIKLLMPFVDDLVTMDSKLETAIGAAAKLKELFEVFYKSFNDLYESATGQKVVDTAEAQGGNSGSTELTLGIESYLNKMAQRVSLFTRVSEFLNSLTSAFDKIDDISSFDSKLKEVHKTINSEEFSNFLKDLVNVLKKAVEASDLGGDMAKLGSTQYIVERQSGMALALELLGNAMEILASGISGFDENNVKSFDQMLGVFEKLYSGLGDVTVEAGSLAKAFLGDNSLSKLGEEIKIFGSYLYSFYEQVKLIPGFSDSEVDNTQAKIDSIVKVAQGMATALVLLQGAAVGTNMEIFSSGLPDMGENIGKFVSEMNRGLTGLTTEQVTNVAMAAQSLSNLSAILEMFPINDVSAKIKSVQEALTGQPGLQFGSTLRSFVDIVVEAFNGDESHKKFKGVGMTLAGALAEGMQEAMTNNPELRITPVLNLDGAKQQLIDFFGIGTLENFNFSEIVKSAVGANSQTDEDRIKATELYTRLDNLEIAVNNISSNSVSVSDVTSAFSRMQVVLYPDRVAGELTDYIDEAIGQKIWLINNNVTPG